MSESGDPRGRLGQAEVEHFHREGYLVLERCLDAAALEPLRAAADRAMTQERERLLRGDPRFVPVSLLDDRYVVTGFCTHDASVQALALGELAADVCGALLGPDAYLFSDTFVLKAPQNRHGWIWHQDSSYLDHMGCGHYPPNLSVWVALDDMTRENGALRVLPFSTLDVRRVVRHDLEKDWTSDEVVDFGRHEGLLLEVPAGSVVAFDGALPHASDPNRTTQVRRAYLIQYSREPVQKEGKLVQRAIPLLQQGRRLPPPPLVRPPA